jgi:predicted nuclease of predicted toxin-antitoxin system
MRFLIDECLSIDLVSVAHQAGHEAQHVARVGKAGCDGYQTKINSALREYIAQRDDVR